MSEGGSGRGFTVSLPFLGGLFQGGPEGPSQYEQTLRQTAFNLEQVRRTGDFGTFAGPSIPIAQEESRRSRFFGALVPVYERVLETGQIPTPDFWSRWIRDFQWAGPDAVGSDTQRVPIPAAFGSGLGFQALPGTPGAPVPPQSPQLPDWRDVLWQAADAGLRLWLELRARDAARRRAKDLSYFLRTLGGRITTGAQRMPDLLQLGGFSPLNFSEGGGLLGGLGQAAAGIGSLIRSFREPDAYSQYGDPWGPNVLYSTQERTAAAMAEGLGCGAPFRAGGSALTPTTFTLTNPSTGRATWFGPYGKPVLWSRDMAAARKLKRVGQRARRVCGGRR